MNTTAWSLIISFIKAKVKRKSAKVRAVELKLRNRTTKMWQKSGKFS